MWTPEYLIDAERAFQFPVRICMDAATRCDRRSSCELEAKPISYTAIIDKYMRSDLYVHAGKWPYNIVQAFSADKNCSTRTLKFQINICPDMGHMYGAFGSRLSVPCRKSGEQIASNTLDMFHEKINKDDMYVCAARLTFVCELNACLRMCG